MKMKILGGFLLGVLLVGSAVAAQLGDPAAPLKITEWVKGKPVDLDAEKGKRIVVVEFWATWCPPCRTSIPHLTELQKKFTNTVFVGVSDEEPGVVKKFIAKMGDKMDYTVAIDKDEGTSKGYMRAYGIDGIPHAFVVQDGKVVWQGHPMSGLDTVLADLAAGKYDMEKEKKRMAAKAKLDEFYESAAMASDDEIKKTGAELEALDKELGGIVPGETFNPDEALKAVRFQKAAVDYQRAVIRGKPDSELDPLAQKLQQVAPTNFNFVEFKESLTLTKGMNDYYRIVTGRGDTNKLAEATKVLAETKSKDARVLNDFAWMLLTGDDVQIRDTELATKLAKIAVDATESKQAHVIDTYARGLFDSGKVAEAIEWEKKALAVADDDSRPKVQATLKMYEASAKPK